MRILIVQLGTPCECLITTCLIKGFLGEYKDLDLWVAVSGKEQKAIFSFHPSISRVLLHNELDEFKNDAFDKIINLSPNFTWANANNVIGFGCSPESETYYEYLYNTETTNKNIFQIYYNLSGLKWEGQGYDLRYYPRTKCDRNKTGLAVANRTLRSYIIKALKLEASKIWHIPFHEDIFRRIDEVNRCANLVTDDFSFMHLGVCLRKYTYFLKTMPCSMRLEFFGKGKIIKVPIEILRWL